MIFVYLRVAQTDVGLVVLLDNFQRWPILSFILGLGTTIIKCQSAMRATGFESLMPIDF